MRNPLLLDTHALLWWLADLPALGSQAREAIADPANRVLVSAASIWEIEIKRALGKLRAPGDIQAAVKACAFEALPMTFDHAVAAGRLPPHHQDPFDRMLIGQAATQQLVIVTQEAAFGSYGVAILDARR